MEEEPSSYFAMIQRCEAAIIRIRAALRAGASDTEAVGQDWELIRQGVLPRLTRYARSAATLAPEADLEALYAMVDRLFDDIRSLSFVSLETKLGAYLNHMPQRVLRNLRRKYGRDDASSTVQRLDATDEFGQSLYDTIADPHGQDPFVNIGERDALAQAIKRLPADERYVVSLRLQDYDNNTIAQRLDVSAPTASRIYRRAVARLRQWLADSEE